MVYSRYCMRLHADQGSVMQSVISAFEFQDFVASGGSAGQADAVHRSFGATVPETQHFYRKTLADFFRQLPFHVMRHAEHGAGGQAGADGFHDRWMAMPGHQRAEAEIVVEIVVAVEVAEM